jgi:Putative transposase
MKPFGWPKGIFLQARYLRCWTPATMRRGFADSRDRRRSCVPPVTGVSFGLLRANATASGGTPSGSSSPTTGSYPDNRKVRFRWKNYRDGSQQKTITLDGDEYIRRFLIHMLPDGFHRIRHYGFLGDCHRGRKLAHCRELLGMAPPGVAQVRRSLDLIGETMAMLEATTVSPAASAALIVARLLGELGHMYTGSGLNWTSSTRATWPIQCICAAIIFRSLPWTGLLSQGPCAPQCSSPSMAQ